MKRKKCLISIFIVVFLLLFPFNSFAFSEDYFDEQIETSGANKLLEELSDEQKSLLKTLGIECIDFESILSVSPHRIFDLIFEVFSNNYHGPLKASFTVAAMILVISIASQFISYDSKMFKVVSAIGSLLTSLSVMIPLSSCVTRVISAIDLSADFMLSLIPILAAVISVSGNPVLAFSYNSLCFIAAQAVAQLADNFIRPLIQVMLSISTISSINEEVSFEKLIAFMKKIAVFIISTVSTVFVTLLSVKGMLANTADGVAVRGIRFLIGNIVPFIGGAVSDAYLSIIGTLSMVKNTVAVFAIAVVAITNLPVTAECLCWVFTLNLLEALSDMFSQKSISFLLSSYASAVSLLTVILLLNSVVFVLSIGLVMLFKGG